MEVGKVEREFRFIQQFQLVDGLHPLQFAPCPFDPDTCSSLFLSTNVTVYKRTYLTSKTNPPSLERVELSSCAKPPIGH